jgi:hypothetical protein
MLDQVGRYRVKGHLGSGAFATVWLAEDEELASFVAIKVLADNWSHHLDVRARFTQEAQIMRRADSDRLVRVLDLGELPDGRPYLVMTYAAGGTLADRLAAGPMPVDAAVRTAVDIARGVAVLHGVGVIHRDLKPSNVLLAGPSGQQRVLIADLGLAKAIAQASGFTVIAGSPGYMAPEQAILGGGLDVRADVYAVGALAYHMLTGRPPTEVSTVNAVPTAASVRVERPSKVRPGIPASVDDIVLRALRRDPRGRWPSAVAFADALEAAEGARPSPRRRHRLARLVAVATTVVAAGLGAAGSTTAGGSAQPWVRVTDVTHSVSLAVPPFWAKQVRDAGWDPATIGLPTGHVAGLLVGPDLTAWPDPTSGVPGVFAGISGSLREGGPTPTLPDHEGCARQPDRELTVGPLTAKVHRWIHCGGTSISFSEVLLTNPRSEYGVYVQVKQIDEHDYTDDILRALVLTNPRVAAAGRTG